jgi:RNase P subunit RPR2
VILKDKWATSRKYRYCELCDDLIAPNDRYRYLFGGFSKGKMYSFTCCEQCGQEYNITEMPIVEGEC